MSDSPPDSIVDAPKRVRLQLSTPEGMAPGSSKVKVNLADVKVRVGGLEPFFAQPDATQVRVLPPALRQLAHLAPSVQYDGAGMGHAFNAISPHLCSSLLFSLRPRPFVLLRKVDNK